MIFGQHIGQACAQRNLDPLYGVEDEQAKPAVEDVEIQNIIKGCACPEMVFGIASLEGERVCTEAVITDDGEIAFSPGTVRDGKAPADPLVDMLLYGKGRFAEICHARNLRA